MFKNLYIEYSKVAKFILMSFFLSLILLIPLNEPSSLIINLIKTIFSFSVSFMIIALCYNILSVLYRGDKLNFSNTIYGFLKHFIILIVSLKLISLIGDDVIYAHNHAPENFYSYLFVISFIIIFTKKVFKLDLSYSRPNNVINLIGIKKKHAITEEEKMSVSSHEAGHFIFYCLLEKEKIPDILEASINGDGRSEGRVRGVTYESILSNRKNSEWFMMQLIGSKVAEDYLTSSNSLGSGLDNELWVKIANIYCANNFDGEVFYNKPNNEYESLVNSKILNNLYRKQLEQVKEFLKLNIDILRDIQLELYDKKVLKKDDILKYLDKIIVPKDFPIYS